MRPVKTAWPASQAATNTKFVAQLLRELLSRDSFPSFRVATLDASARLIELEKLADDFLEKRIPAVALEPALREVATTLKQDKIIQELVPGKATYFIEQCVSPPSDDGKAKAIRAAAVAIHKSVMESYRTQLERRICVLYDKEHSNIELFHLVSLYAAMIINLGYARVFVEREVHRRFFAKDIKKVDSRTLAAFFSLFSGVNKKYKICYPISNLLANYLGAMKLKGVEIKKEEELGDSFLAIVRGNGNYNNGDQYFLQVLEAKDPFTALSRLRNVISALSSFGFMHRHGIEVQLKTHGYVSTFKGRDPEVIDLEGVVFQSPAHSITKRMANDIQLTSSQVLTRFTRVSSTRLINAVRTSAQARATSNPDTQLVALWSAVEVLLSEPHTGTARVVQYVNLLTPCVCARYVRNYVIAVFNELNISYRRGLRSVISSVLCGTRNDDYSRLIYLLVLPEFEVEREKLCAILAEIPLALFRLWSLRENLSSFNNLEKMILSHEERVRWQLHRIYRIRNLIVHNGGVPGFIQPLVVNLFEYFRTSITAILARSNLESDKLDVDQVVAEIGIDYHVMKASLIQGKKRGKDSSLTLDDLQTLIR